METSFHYKLFRFFPSSDPTYKEWKPRTVISISVVSIGSDPTYKEWKHEFWGARVIIEMYARILPTRNGNSKGR